MAHLLQDRDEFDVFCRLMASEKVRSYLEIGSFSGGSIELAVNVLPKGSRIVSVDKPWKSSKEYKLRQLLLRLKQSGYDTHLIIGDSTHSKTIAAARALGPYDAVFIDGDHRLETVTRDWENYGPMGRIIGFHDIARDIMVDPWGGGPHQVASFWKQLDKKKYRHEEIISERTRARTDMKAVYGIGVVWNV